MRPFQVHEPSEPPLKPLLMAFQVGGTWRVPDAIHQVFDTFRNSCLCCAGRESASPSRFWADFLILAQKHHFTALQEMSLMAHKVTVDALLDCSPRKVFEVRHMNSLVTAEYLNLAPLILHHHSAL